MAVKKRVLTKWATISNELKREVKSVYPQGFKHKLENVLKGKERYIQVLPFETSEIIYFIEIPFRAIRSVASDSNEYIDYDNNYSASERSNEEEDDDVTTHAFYAQDDADSYTDMID